MIVPPMVKTPGQVAVVLILLWSLFIAFNIFLSGKPIFSKTNIIFISLIIITIVIYLVGKKVFGSKKEE